MRIGSPSTRRGLGPEHLQSRNQGAVLCREGGSGHSYHSRPERIAEKSQGDEVRRNSVGGKGQRSGCRNRAGRRSALQWPVGLDWMIFSLTKEVEMVTGKSHCVLIFTHTTLKCVADFCSYAIVAQQKGHRKPTSVL